MKILLYFSLKLVDMEIKYIFLFYFKQRFFILFYFKQRLFQFYVFLDFRFYPLHGFFMSIKRVDYRYFQAISSTSVWSFLSLSKKVSNLEALRIHIPIWIYSVAYVYHFDKHLQTHLVHFFFSSCLHSKFYRRDIIFMYRNVSYYLKDTEFCFQNKVFASFASVL